MANAEYTLPVKPDNYGYIHLKVSGGNHEPYQYFTDPEEGKPRGVEFIEVSKNTAWHRKKWENAKARAAELEEANEKLEEENEQLKDFLWSEGLKRADFKRFLEKGKNKGGTDSDGMMGKDKGGMMGKDKGGMEEKGKGGMMGKEKGGKGGHYDHGVPGSSNDFLANRERDPYR